MLDRLSAERMINVARYLFAFFFLLTGVFSYLSNSAPGVYISILACSFVILSVSVLNSYLIHTKQITRKVIFFSATMEVLTVFFVKFSFHFDVYNSWGLAIKEQATFLAFIVFAIINASRYDKVLNLYYGLLVIITYSILIFLGLTLGDMVFVKEKDLIFTPNSLRIPTEAAKLIFLGGITYFLYKMGGFTSNKIDTIEKARLQADKSYNFINNIFQTVKNTGGELSVSSEVLKKSTDNIDSIVKKNNVIIGEISDITGNVSGSIKDIEERLLSQSGSIKECLGKIQRFSDLMKEVSDKSSVHSDKAREALSLAEVNEKNLSEFASSISEMQQNSKKIEDISKAINEIADQTGLLALNAAIESARAGEAGRGFAVVSDQISELAGKSSESSKEIATIISSTVRNILIVSNSLSGMSTDMKNIINHVRENTSFVHQINEDSKREYEHTLHLYESNSQISETTMEVISNYKNQMDMMYKIINWMDQMKEMSSEVSDNSEMLVEISDTLTSNAEILNGLLNEARK